MRHCLEHEECNAELNGILKGNPTEELFIYSAYNKNLECYRDFFADYILR